MNFPKNREKTMRTILPALGIAAALALLLAPAAVADPATDISKPPEPQELRAVDFPEFHQKTLANGLRLVVVEHHEQPTVSLRLVIGAGRIHETAEKAGIANATAALLTQGTESRSAQEIAQEIDFVGGSLSAGSGSDQTYASAFVTSDKIDLGLELLSDVVLHANFPDEEIERWRTQTLSGLQVQMSDPSNVASQAFSRLVYGEHPYGLPSQGTPASVRGLTRDDLAAFHRAHYLPQRSILAIVGDVTPEVAFAKAEKAFGGWEQGEAAALPAAPSAEREGRQIVVLDKPDAVQTELRVGHLAISRTDPAYVTAQVYNSILGGSSSARIYKEIRRERGLSYGAYSSFTERDQGGHFTASTFTKTESTVEALGLIFEVIEGLEKETVPEDELAARRTYISGAFPLSIETPDGIATQVLDALTNGFDRPYLETYTQKIDAVTAKEVKAFAEKHVHPENTLVVLVGNAEGFAEELGAKYGEFEHIPFSEVDLLSPDLRKEQEAAAPVSEADAAAAKALVEKVIEAHGGEAFTGQKTQILKGSGTFSPPGAPQPMELPSFVSYESLTDDKSRTELTMPMGQMVQGWNGEKGWVQFGPQVQDVTQQMAASKPYGTESLRNFHEGGYEVRPIEGQEVEGVATKGFAITDGEGHTTHFYVDPESHYLLKVGFEAGGALTEQVMGDYKVVDGIAIPHSTQVFQNGNLGMEMTVSEVEVNTEIDPAIFEMPEG